VKSPNNRVSLQKSSLALFLTSYRENDSSDVLKSNAQISNEEINSLEKKKK